MGQRTFKLPITTTSGAEGPPVMGQRAAIPPSSRLQGSSPPGPTCS